MKIQRNEMARWLIYISSALIFVATVGLSALTKYAQEAENISAEILAIELNIDRHQYWMAQSFNERNKSITLTKSSKILALLGNEEEYNKGMQQAIESMKTAIRLTQLAINAINNIDTKPKWHESELADTLKLDLALNEFIKESALGYRHKSKQKELLSKSYRKITSSNEWYQLLFIILNSVGLFLGLVSFYVQKKNT